MTPGKRYRVAVDAMGGDYAPQESVAGAIEAAENGLVDLILVGDPEAVEPEMAKHSTSHLPIHVVPSEGVVAEGDHPIAALRRRPRASVAVAADLVKHGEADAFVTMGSTGAAMAVAVLSLGLFEGLERPALGGPFLPPLAPLTSVIDMGSNLDCRPSQLVSFAAIGCTFARCLLGVHNPRVGLLSVGAEEGKGNRQVRETFPLLRASGLNFVGNVEGHDVFLNKADVVVCDGFVGNVLLKYTEGLGAALASYLAGHLDGQVPPDVARDVLQHLTDACTTAAVRTGGPLFGVNGIVVIGHGRARASTVAGSVELARLMLELDLDRTMKEDLAMVRQRANA